MEQYTPPCVVAESDQDTRAQFIKNTYLHLAYAVLGFIAVEYVLINYTPLGQMMMSFLSKSAYMWLVVLGGFMGVSWLAQSMAGNGASKGIQYAGLGLYVVGTSIIFLPLLFMAALYSPNAIGQAAVATGGLFMALTVIAFTTKKDFSFLGGMIKVGFIVALALIGASIMFGFNLGLIFSAAMILLSAGSILYSTSNIIHHYHPSQYVAAPANTWLLLSDSLLVYLLFFGTCYGFLCHEIRTC